MTGRRLLSAGTWSVIALFWLNLNVGCVVNPDTSLIPPDSDAVADAASHDAGGDSPAWDLQTAESHPPDAPQDLSPDMPNPDIFQPDILSPDILPPDAIPHPDGFKADVAGPGGVLPIYRSVGPGNTTPLASGPTSGNPLVVSGTLATFTVALPAKVGVGDVIQYDADSDDDIDANDALGFIHRRYSSTQYSIRTASAGVPPSAASTAVWQVFRAYTSLADAMSAQENTGIVQGLSDFDSWTGGRDLVANNEAWNIACYADASDTQSVQVAGWTTSSTNALRVFTPTTADTVGASQRHTGVAGTGYVIETGATAHVLDIQSDHVTLEGLEITGWVNEPANNSWEGVHVAADQALLQDLLVHDDLHPTTTNPNADGINLNSMSDGQSVTIRNCVVYNISRGAINYQGALALTVTIESCTVHNTGASLTQADGQGGINITSAVSTVDVSNTISVGSGAGADFKTGSPWGSSSHNLSSDGSAPGTGSLLNKAAAGLFVDVTAGAEDLHLAAGAEAIDKGKDLSSRFNTDIDGQIRTGTWDIGADEQ
jgi:hypothetical protein